MDEVRFNEMDTKAEGVSHQANHPPPHEAGVSKMEFYTDATGSLTTDPASAHHAAGDDEYEKFIPRACHSCEATEIATEEAKKIQKIRTDECHGR